METLEEISFEPFGREDGDDSREHDPYKYESMVLMTTFEGYDDESMYENF